MSDWYGLRFTNLNRTIHTSEYWMEGRLIMSLISLFALIIVSLVLFPKEQHKPKLIQVGLSFILLMGWTFYSRQFGSFWFHPFLSVNFNITDSVFETEMQETGILLIGGLWIATATVIFPVAHLGHRIWQRFKKSPS